MGYSIRTMSNVEFDTDMQLNPRYAQQRPNSPGQMQQSSLNQPQAKGMVGWLIKHGIIDSDAGARAILFGVVIFNFLVAAFIIYFFVLR